MSSRGLSFVSLFLLDSHTGAITIGTIADFSAPDLSLCRLDDLWSSFSSKNARIEVVAKKIEHQKNFNGSLKISMGGMDLRGHWIFIIFGVIGFL